MVGAQAAMVGREDDGRASRQLWITINQGKNRPQPVVDRFDGIAVFASGCDIPTITVANGVRIRQMKKSMVQRLARHVGDQCVYQFSRVAVRSEENTSELQS